MTFLDYLALIRRNWIACVILTAIVTISAIALVQWKNTNSFATTIFVTVGNLEGTNPQNNPTSIYENIQASDDFSQTVQGWFKNPDFLTRISQKAGIKNTLNATSQAKQNLTITFDTSTEEAAGMLSKTLKEELNGEIQTYNTNTNNKYQTAIFEVNTEKKPLSLLLFTIIGVICGFVAASFLLYGYEYFLRKISYPSQAAEILQKEPIEILPSSKTANQELQFLSAYLHKMEGKNIQIIGTNNRAAEISKQLEHLVTNKTLSSVTFPQESGKISMHDHQVIICALGRTTVDDLNKIRALSSHSFDLVIVEA